MTDVFSRPRRVLLLNPPIVDLRVPWADWVEPTGLLKIGTLLRARGCDVRLLDCFRSAPLRKRRHAILEREGQRLYQWSYGLDAPGIRRELRALRHDQWIPDHVLITTLTSPWWHGAAIAAAQVRSIFPVATIILGGAYPLHAREHAIQHGGADQVGDDDLASEAASLPPALELCKGKIASIAVTSIAEVGVEATLDTIDAAVLRGATRIHLADHGIASRAPFLLENLLSRLALVHARTRLYVLGEISAQEVAAWPDLPRLLCAARCRQLVLSDNRDYPVDSVGEETFIQDVRRATEAVLATRLRWRTDDYGVEQCIGRSGEPPERSAGLLPRLAHVAGSVIPVPFQTTLQEIGAHDPWDTNAKLFPLAERNGSSFMAYMELLGLCTVANAKYRARTFDFLNEDSLIAQSLRRALRDRAWDPHGNEIINLPMFDEMEA